MKKPLISNRFLIICFCIFAAIVILFMVNTYLYVRASQLKIVEDISPNELQLLQKEFGINLPPQAQITRSGYCSDSIVIRIEGVEDLSSFLTDSIHLELDQEGLQNLTDLIYRVIEGDNNLSADMYGIERSSMGFLNSDYLTNPIDYSATTDFFLLDGKLVIEIKMSDTTTENRENIKKIFDS